LRVSHRDEKRRYSWGERSPGTVNLLDVGNKTIPQINVKGVVRRTVSGVRSILAPGEKKDPMTSERTMGGRWKYGNVGEESLVVGDLKGENEHGFLRCSGKEDV